MGWREGLALLGVGVALTPALAFSQAVVGKRVLPAKVGLLAPIVDGDAWQMEPRAKGRPQVNYDGGTINIVAAPRDPGKNNVPLARVVHAMGPVKAGQTFTLSFVARADAPSPLRATVEAPGGTGVPANNLGLDFEVALETGEKPFAQIFTIATDMPAGARLALSLPNGGGVFLRDVVLVAGVPNIPPPGLSTGEPDTDPNTVPDFGRARFSGIWFVKIPAGSFSRGMTAAQKSTLEKAGLWSRLYDEEMPARKISISRPFFLAETEVTQAQWRKFRANPSAFGKAGNADSLPVENISHDDARAFCDWLSLRGSGTFRLPTEAQWEYAARAGSGGLWQNAKSGEVTPANLAQHAWFFGNSGNKTHPVATRQANAWGLFDMSGNVWEWCDDAYRFDFYAKSPATDPLCAEPGATERVMRGGCWILDQSKQRPGLRGGNLPTFKSPYVGFRLVREIR